MYPAFDANAHFPHRVNRDGTIDAICPRCYITIGTANCEPDLSRMESAHICSPARLDYYHPENDGSGKILGDETGPESGHGVCPGTLRGSA